MVSRALGHGEVYWSGTRLSVSSEVAHSISLRAAEIVRQKAPRGPHNSRMKVRATQQSGQIGVYFPPDAMHLIYLDRGIRPFLMKGLEGKIIPIRLPGGGMSFRKAKNVGQRQIIARDENGNVAFSKLRWQHPGVSPMNFIQPSIQQAINEWKQTLTKSSLMNNLQSIKGPMSQLFSRFKKVNPNAFRPPPKVVKQKRIK